MLQPRATVATLAFATEEANRAVTWHVEKGYRGPSDVSRTSTSGHGSLGSLTSFDNILAARRRRQVRNLPRRAAAGPVVRVRCARAKRQIFVRAVTSDDAYLSLQRRGGRRRIHGCHAAGASKCTRRACTACTCPCNKPASCPRRALAVAGATWPQQGLASAAPAPSLACTSAGLPMHTAVVRSHSHCASTCCRTRELLC